ncbi:hypothetical protein ZS59_00405 [Salmonella enterica subsp. enterica serovar Typhimurium]|nr:hypothetical protein [Salmonella enterica subsp. enterica serovar Typhimurium]
MIASVFKLLPFLQMLWEAFKPGEGEKVTRAGKIVTLVIVALIAFSAFVSYAYIVQYHTLVSVQSRTQYLEISYKELKEKSDHGEVENNKLYDRLFTCLGSRPPYDGTKSPTGTGTGAAVPPEELKPVTPQAPLNPSSPPAKKHQAASRPVGSQAANDFRQEIISTLNNP